MLRNISLRRSRSSRAPPPPLLPDFARPNNNELCVPKLLDARQHNNAHNWCGALCRLVRLSAACDLSSSLRRVEERMYTYDIHIIYIYTRIIYIFIRAPKWACDRDARRIVDPNCWCGGYKALTKPPRTRLIFVGRAAKTSIARCGVVLLLVRC